MRREALFFLFIRKENFLVERSLLLVSLFFLQSKLLIRNYWGLSNNVNEINELEFLIKMILISIDIKFDLKFDQYIYNIGSEKIIVQNMK